MYQISLERSETTSPTNLNTNELLLRAFGEYFCAAAQIKGETEPTSLTPDYYYLSKGGGYRDYQIEDELCQTHWTSPNVSKGCVPHLFQFP